MIPKKIHYCWFSGDDFPSNIKRCIDSWRDKLNEYEIIEWNSSNFDFSINKYVEEAAKARKWAFVSDYARLYVLYQEGGIYLDSDIEVIKKFDDLLQNKAFSGFESKGMVAAWLFGTEAHNPIFKEFLDYYKNRSFLLNNGEYDLTPNPIPISNICKKHGMISIDKYQKLDYITIYPEEYFCTKSVIDGRINITDNSYTIHHFDGGWQSKSDKIIKKIKYLVFSVIGQKYYPTIRAIYRKYIRNLDE